MGNVSSERLDEEEGRDEREEEEARDERVSSEIKFCACCRRSKKEKEESRALSIACPEQTVDWGENQSTISESSSQDIIDWNNAFDPQTSTPQTLSSIPPENKSQTSSADGQEKQQETKETKETKKKSPRKRRRMSGRRRKRMNERRKRSESMSSENISSPTSGLKRNSFHEVAAGTYLWNPIREMLDYREGVLTLMQSGIARWIGKKIYTREFLEYDGMKTTSLIMSGKWNQTGNKVHLVFDETSETGKHITGEADHEEEYVKRNAILDEDWKDFIFEIDVESSKQRGGLGQPIIVHS